MTGTLYRLHEPDTGEIRYLGITIRPVAQRFWEHLKEGKNPKFKDRKNNWIRSLLKRGLRPRVEIELDEIAEGEAGPIEVAYIQFYRDEGFDLVNGTPGGDGAGAGKNHPSFGRKVPHEEREKMSLAQTGRKHSKKTRNQMRLSAIGHKRNAGRKQTPERIAERVARHVGAKRSPESRRNMSRAQRKRFQKMPVCK